jgi:inosine/xanthosine triphosphate pyrophosphatase family protein
MQNNILFATTNKHKEKIFKKAWEYSSLSNNFGYVTLSDIGVSIDVPEDSGTFEGDAMTKAQAYGEEIGMITISQDRGFVFDELNWPGTLTKQVTIGSDSVVIGPDGFPEIKTGGPVINTLEKAKKLLKVLEGKNRTMTVINATAVYIPHSKMISHENTYTKGLAALMPEEGLEGSFSRYFIPAGDTRPLSVKFDTVDDLISYWARTICPIPDSIEREIHSFLTIEK